MKIAVSACLLGHNCKYNGKNNLDSRLAHFLEDQDVLPFCPEMEGGLPTPRTPCEIVQEKVLDLEGSDRTEAYRRGAEHAADRILEQGIEHVIVQPRSPSCGKNQVYDGTFTGTLIPGSGIFCRLAQVKGLQVWEPEEILSCHTFKNVLE